MAFTWSRENRTANLLVNDSKETFQVDYAATIDLPFSSKQSFNIGRKYGAFNVTGYRGYVRDVKLFEMALSDAEVTEIKGLFAYRLQATVSNRGTRKSCFF